MLCRIKRRFVTTPRHDEIADDDVELACRPAQKIPRVFYNYFRFERSHNSEICRGEMDLCGVHDFRHDLDCRDSLDWVERRGAGSNARAQAEERNLFWRSV